MCILPDFVCNNVLIIAFYFHWFCFPTHPVQYERRKNKWINPVQSGIILPGVTIVFSNILDPTSKNLDIAISTGRY